MNIPSLRKTRNAVMEQQRFIGEQLAPFVDALRDRTVEHGAQLTALQARLDAFDDATATFRGRVRWLLRGRA